MDKLFAPEGTVMDFLEKATNLVVLNVLWIVSCIPLITVGAATTALYDMIYKIEEGGATHMCKGYFTSFRKNFGRATVIWIGMLFFVVLMVAEVFYYIHGPKNGRLILLLPVCVDTFVVITAVYLFPLLAVFQENIKQTCKRAAFFAVAYLPYTICILAISALPIFFLWLFAGFMKIASYIMLVIGFAFCAWIKTYFFKKLFTDMQSKKE